MMGCLVVELKGGGSLGLGLPATIGARPQDDPKGECGSNRSEKLFLSGKERERGKREEEKNVGKERRKGKEEKRQNRIGI